MRVHANQIDPNIQLDAMYAAQKAAAKREVARTRKKLIESASELAGEVEDCVVELKKRQESEQEASPQRPQKPPSPQTRAQIQSRMKRFRIGLGIDS